MADSSAPLDFPLLKLVSDARSTYGLRHQDYGRYRSHCVAKVHHLRKSIGLTQTAGKTRKYQKKEVLAEKVTSDKHLQIVLFDSERCWAQSQLLKSTLNDPSASSTTKHHFSKRLSKASSRARDLLELSQSPALTSRLSAAHVGQIQAYYLLLTGSLSFEKGNHAEGLRVLSAAYEVLSTLASTASSATEEALANERADEVEPMLRFCAYRLGKDTAAGVATIASAEAAAALPELVPGWDALKERLEKEGKEGKKETVEVYWRGELVPVRNAELVGVAAKVKEALASLEKDQAIGAKKGGEASEGKKKATEGGKKEILGARRMGTYDKALLVLSDAEAVAGQLVEDDKIATSKNATARSATTTRPLTLFHSFIQYHLLSVRTKRDLLLIASTLTKLSSREAKIAHAEETYVARTEMRDPAVAKGKVERLRAKAYPGLVKVYDGVLLSLEAMRDLEVVEQDDELATTAEARIAYIRAERCKYLSRGYSLARSPTSQTFPSSLSLNARAKLYLRQARSSASAVASLDAEPFDGEHDFIADVLPLVDSDGAGEASFAKLEKELEADHDAISKKWYEATGGEPLDGGEEDDLRGVQDLSLSGAGVAAKEGKKKGPAFYDVAFNYVVGFDFDAIAAKAGLREEAGAGGKGAEKMDVEESDDEEEQVLAAQEEQQGTPSKKKGWFGFLGR
ncbi:hypothetical protein JCM6882_000686 [Rhodosporidiobolus microsporus]